MLQRIQSVYLFLSAALLLAAFFYPVISFINQQQIWLEVYISGFKDYSSPKLELNTYITYPMLFLLILTQLMALFAVFTYKNRKSQMRLAKTGITLLLVVIALIFFYYGNVLGKVTLSTPDFNHTGIYLILAALVMLVLANRSILRDDKLVKAADRLR